MLRRLDLDDNGYSLRHRVGQCTGDMLDSN